MHFLDTMYLRAKFGLENFVRDVFFNEEGDTNLISILIVLGIVLALVVIFRGYIGKILSKVKTGVDSFSVEVTDTGMSISNSFS